MISLAGPHLVDATAYRIRPDLEAEKAVFAAITGPDAMNTSTAMWDFDGRTYTAASSQRSHHQILLASILGSVTGLTTDVAAALAPLSDSDSVLQDNPLMAPRPIRLAVLDLLDAAR